MSQLEDISLCPSSCAKAQHWGGQRQSGAELVPNPSPAPALTHCITALQKPSLTGKPARCCGQKASLSRSDVHLNSSLCRAQQRRSVSAATPAHVPVQAAPVHICLFFFFLSSPSLTAIKGKRWQQDNCWEFLLLYVHRTPL